MELAEAAIVAIIRQSGEWGVSAEKLPSKLGFAHNRAMGARELAIEICRTLREAGYQGYLVGGCVRDILLGREPEDYDVSTDATPDEVQKLFSRTAGVGAQFGVMIVMGDSAQVEVATFRSDVGYSDGRHPDRVEYSKTAEEDVRRRDFTINALLLDPETNDVLDFVGGREDLRAGIVRAIGRAEERFREDKLRMIRGVRFAARFRYAIEAKTFLAIRLLSDQISRVSPERIRDELTKVLTEGAARRGFELLDETGVLEHVLPEISAMKGIEQPAQFHPEGDVWVHTMMMLEGLKAGSSTTLAWGVLLHDVGKPPTFTPASGPGTRIRFDEHVEVGTAMAASICRRLRFSNDEIEQIMSLVANHLRFKDVPQMKASTLKRFVRLNRFDEHMELHRLDCLSSHRNLENYEFMRRFLAETPPEVVQPPRLLTGEDLIAMGYKPGPAFKRILEAVEEGQLDGRIQGRQEALKFVEKSFSRTVDS